MNTYRYQDWNEPYGRIHGEPYSEEEARRRFDAQKTVTVLVGDPAAPEVVVEVELGGRWVKAMWLDRLARPELSYLWVQPPDEGWPEHRLLLEQVHSLAYDHDQRLPEGDTTYDESYVFHPDGRWYGSRGHRDGDDSEESQGEAPDELQIEDVPAFGAWEPFLTKER